MASLASGMAMPIVSGPVVRMNAAKKSPKAKPKKEEGKSFFDQLGEWTVKSSMKETDPVLKRAEEKREKEKKVVEEKKPAAPKKKSWFGF